MTLDSSNSHSTANETTFFQTTENNDVQKGTHVSEPDSKTGSEVEKYTVANSNLNQHADSNTADEAPKPWCYLFVHHRKVGNFEKLLKKDGQTYFIHTSIKYASTQENARGVKKIIVQTVSGLVFIRGYASEVQKYLDEKFPGHRLCKNRCTDQAAEIPNSQMEPFMRVVKADPDRVRFLLRPFIYYSKNRTLLRIVSGDFAGMEGYVIRIARDRRIVIDVGGIGVAIGGIHAERFEEVGKNEKTKQDRAIFHKRNLHERNAFIDRYFHKVTMVQEVAEQAESIEMLRLQTIADKENGALEVKDAYETLCFMIEEIGYYYAPFVDTFKNELNPIFDAGRKVLHDISAIITSTPHDSDLRQRREVEYEELNTNYGYLFVSNPPS